jgi:chaperonin GroES
MAKSKTENTKNSNPGGVHPLEDRVMVRPDEAETITAGGIVLPDTAQEAPTRGKVIAVGPGKLNKVGKRIPTSVKPGDTVIYGKYSGSDIKTGGQEYKILRESDLLGRIEG